MARRGTEGRGFCRAAEGAGGAGTQWRRGGGGWERVEGLAKGLSAAATLHEGFFGDPGSGQGWETGRAWWALHALLLLGSGWPWVWLRVVRTGDLSSEPEQGKKRKLAPKIPFFVCLGVRASACVRPCASCSNPVPAALLNPR